MKMFLYYAFCSLKNQIKKLFKTWVAVFFGICLLFGLVIGVSLGFLTESLDEGEDYSSYDDEFIYSDEYLSDGSVYYEENVSMPPEIGIGIADGVVFILALGAVVWALLSGDKTGGKNFMMADVNLLFSAPLSPQSVLLFKLMTQLGTSLVASIYLMFQLPNLIMNMELSPFAAVTICVVWILLLAFSKLFQMLSFVGATGNRFYKKAVTPIAWGLVGIAALALYLFVSNSPADPLSAAITFFSSSGIRMIPVVGWLTAAVHFAVAGNIWLSLLYIVLSGAAIAVLVYIIWKMKADFYEESLISSEETDKVQKAAAEGKVYSSNAKPRKEKLRRDGIGRGWGANVYLYKALYNRFRFATLRIFTKTTVTYLIAAALTAAVTLFAFESHTIVPVALVLAVFVFYRSLGNPLSQDIEQISFSMIPESTHKKLFFSLLAGTVDCALDLLPAMVISTVLLAADPLAALFWWLFIISVDFYSSSVGTFISLSIPTATAKVIRSVIQICFIYFGLVPVAVLMVAGFITDMFLLFTALAALFCLLCGGIFFALSPLFITGGRK